MKKIIILLAAVVILGGAGIWYFTSRSSLKNILSPNISSPAETPKESVSAMGWSVSANEEQAVGEAVAMMAATLKKNPDFAFVYCASAYNEEKVLAEANRLLPGTKIIGGNSGYGVLTPGGYFLFPETAQSLGILGVATEKITWGVGSAPLTTITATSSKAAAKQAVLEAIKSAGKKETDKPDLVLDVSSFKVQHESVLQGIAQALGSEAPVFGAYAVDKGAAGDWRVFANDQVFHDGVAIAVVYTDLKIGFFREHGFETTEKGGVVTKVEGNNLVEIDGRPAAEVYNELIGGLLENEVKNPSDAGGSKVRMTGAINPLAKVLRIPGRDIFYVPILPVKFLADKSILTDSILAVGDELQLLRGDWEILLNRLRTTPEKAMAKFDMDKDKNLFALNSYCCATNYVVPATERPKESQILGDALGGIPFIGVFACGIQTPEPGIGNIYTSLGNGVLIFGEE